MSISQIILKQVAIMFILMMIGYLLYKKKMISDQGSKDLGKILIYLVIPVVIVNNFCIEKTPENVEALIFSAIIALISMLVAMFVSYLVFKDKNGIASFSSSFSNAGFVGIPIVQATLGNHAVFYISMMIAFVNILQWTYGIFTITNDKSAMSFKKICTNPVVIAVTLGLLIFFFKFLFRKVLKICLI